MSFRLFQGKHLGRERRRLSHGSLSIIPSHRPWLWLPGMGSIAMSLLLWGLGIVHASEPLAQTLLFRARGAEPWDERIVLIKIDQPSLQELGWFPWERDRYIDLLQILNRSRPNTVVFDLIFSEETSVDSAFAAAMTDHGQVVLATAWHGNHQPWLPSPALNEAAIAVGHIAIAPPYPHLAPGQPASQTILAQVRGIPALALSAAQVHQLNHPADIQLPSSHPRLRPNWPGPVEQLQQYSFSEILAENIPAAALQDKIILVGVTAQGFDPFVTPFDTDELSSGVHLHAALVHNLLQHNLLYHPPQFLGIIFLFAWLPATRYGLMALSLRHQLLSLGIGGCAWLILCSVALRFGVALPILMPLLMLGSTALMLLLLNSRQLHHVNLELLEKATVDATTKIKNRFFFNEYAQLIWQQMSTESQPLAIIIGDVDHFKLYNDTYGHPAGGACLYQVAQSLQKSVVRASDLVARYGGEEFIMLLPNTDIHGAEHVAQKIQAQLAQCAIPHQSSLTHAQVTLSLGILCTHPRFSTLTTAIQQADQALYQAKQSGRNCYWMTQALPTSEDKA